MKVVLNAVIARINGGGATQIVYNYLSATLADRDVIWYYIISEEFVELLGDNVRIEASHCLVLPRQPQLKTYFKAKKAIDEFLDVIKPDLVYSILAPSYFIFKYPEVMRCCNAWDVIERGDEAFSFLDWKTRIKFGIKTWLVRRMMQHADYFITQTEEAKSGIIRVTGKDCDNVAVVPNVLPRFFQSIIPVKKSADNIDILYVASPAPHKNIEIVPRVAHMLKHEYGLKGFRFLITIPPEDSVVASQITKSAHELFVEKEVVNIGGKTQKELVGLYESATIGFFPSVLETFSATLLEYMYFSLPIVSSDKPFNKEVLEEAALFFNANDAKGAAESIYAVITNQVLRDSLKERAKQRIMKYLDYSAHYGSTIEFFKYIVERERKKKS